MSMVGFPPRSRFDGLPRAAALALSAALLLLIAIGVWSGVASAPAREGPGDRALYLRVIDDVAHGQSYYAAVAAEYRRGNYPLKPVFAVRTPALATTMAALPEWTRTLALQALVIIVMVAWAWRLHVLFHRPIVVGIGVLLLGVGMVPSLVAGAYVFHETWAGALIALSLAVHEPRRWWPSVVIGLLAVAVRELALPYLAIMSGFALLEGRRREAAAWLIAIVGFAAILLIHAHVLAEFVRPSDASSPGWLALGGWPFVLSTATWNGLLAAAPGWLVAMTVPVMLFGLGAWPGPLSVRLATICLGYDLAFLFAGRPDNTYWGLMLAPLLGLGLLGVPGGARDLLGALFGRGFAPGYQGQAIGEQTEHARNEPGANH